jgi:hypothetical protein
MIDELPGRAGATLGTTDPPRHDRLRALSQAAFARKSIELLVAPTIEIADRALARICEAKAFEFINDFSSQITVGLLFRTMGLPERDHADIRRKVILAVSTDKAVKGRNAAHIAAFKELSDFLTAEVAARRANPTDDLITHLAEAEIDGDRLSEREIVLTTATFVMAGVEFARSSRRTPPGRCERGADRTGDRGVATLQYVGAAIQARRHARNRSPWSKHARRRQGRPGFWVRQPRLAEISRSRRVRH